MKLITLNTWCGKIYEPLTKFIESNANDTDVFCFQEIRNGNYVDLPERDEEVTNLFNNLENILPNFNGYYTEMVQGVGIATFVKKNIEIEKINSHTILFSEELVDVNVMNNLKPFPRVIQITTLKENLSILNFHGVPGNPKKDTKERALQTKRLLIRKNKLGQA